MGLKIVYPLVKLNSTNIFFYRRQKSGKIEKKKWNKNLIKKSIYFDRNLGIENRFILIAINLNWINPQILFYLHWNGTDIKNCSFFKVDPIKNTIFPIFNLYVM
jgi:hypothetical protein